jgi:hypothetical protein
MAVHANPIPAAAAAASGVSTAPAANAVVADTGQLPAGDYLVEVELSAAGVLAAGKALLVQHRNAGNSADVNTLGGCPAATSRSIEVGRVTLALNERIRVVVGAVAFAASETAVASIRVHRL